ncbi:MAG: hypothetical protein GY711_06775 [bacterium]|nr:hypothetical protein [bacterium]
MGRLSLTYLEAPLEAAVPLLSEYYDWLRTPQLRGESPSLEAAANTGRRGCAAILGEIDGRTYVFDRELEPRDLSTLLALSERIGGLALTGFHESITGGTTFVAARAGALLRKHVSEPEENLLVDEGTPLASEAERPFAEGDFDAIVAAAQALGCDWTRWESEGPFRVLSDELDDEQQPPEVLRIDPDAPRPGLIEVLRWMWKMRGRK